MRFLKNANFELGEDGLRVLSVQMEEFLRCGSFTYSEWESLSGVEQAVAVKVRKTLKLEEALNLRAALQANSLDSAAEVLRAGGDDHAADHFVLQDAVERLAKGMDSADFAGATR